MRENEKVKVSVIIYVKNSVNYMEQCVRSVMSQTLGEIEILIVDGGSTDGTLVLIEKLKQEDGRIRLFHGAASVGAQFNLGLREAKGDYIGVCEADDYLLPDMYERQYKTAEENQLDVIRAGYYQVFEIGGQEYRFKLNACGADIPTEKVIQGDDGMLFLGQGINGFWNGLYKRQFLLDHQIWMNETKGAAYQDISFSFFTQMYARRVWFMDEAFYCYRIDNPDASANSLHGVRFHMEEYEILKMRLEKARLWEAYKNMFFSWELVSYQWFLHQLPQNQRVADATAVYRQLLSQYEESAYQIGHVIEKVQKLAEKLISGKEEFLSEILAGTKENEKLLDYMTNSFPSERQVILFGMGHIGTMVCSFLEKYKKEVFFTDNSPHLQKHGIKGKRVYSPKQLTESMLEGRYIVTNAGHSQEMKEQLMKMGVPDERILICSDEAFFLRKIFVKEW